jgi:hypothetical protein
MPDAFTFLLDAPGEPRARIQIAKLGKGFKDGRYGVFDITASEVQSWARNLALMPGQRAAIDRDHSADKPGSDRDTRALGWITAVALEDGTPMADVEWTPAGRKAIEDREYLFFSPTYGNWTDEKGTVHPNSLIGGALTNRPFLNMPTVCLAADPFVAPAPNPPDPDSREAMPDLLKTLAKLHGLPEDATEAKVLEAVAAAKTKADAEPAPTSTDTKTLAAQAQAEGLVLLTAAEDEQRKLDASAGKLALKQMSDQRFESTFTACLSKATVDAKPETKTEWRSLYDAAPDVAIRRLEALTEPVANTTARGEGGDHSETPTTLDGAQLDADSVKLDKAVKQHMKDNPGTGYIAALNAVHDAESMVL